MHLFHPTYNWFFGGSSWHLCSHLPPQELAALPYRGSGAWLQSLPKERQMQLLQRQFLRSEGRDRFFPLNQVVTVVVIWFICLEPQWPLFLKVNPPQNKAEILIKTRVIWVLGGYACWRLGGWETTHMIVLTKAMAWYSERKRWEKLQSQNSWKSVWSRILDFTRYSKKTSGVIPTWRIIPGLVSG